MELKSCVFKVLLSWKFFLFFCEHLYSFKLWKMDCLGSYENTFCLNFGGL